MKTIIALTLLLLTFNVTIYGKGCSGTYFISGTAYSVGKTVLKNDTLTVKFGNKVLSVVTDNNGRFEIELPWTNYCPSGRTEDQHKRDNEKHNPQFIYISYADIEVRLENNWEKYAQCFPKSKKAVTWKKDLKFVNA